ncbi:phage holin [Paenibacillus oleatilyticus]|uniref:phage holin n=1 Tax=Paenibacillus oleatilyticus TaxID=2594886 RepID=UPI001C1F4308|nr:phage holin [Paenibacillus oleatilyticus]MBU7320260.1 phage holin [Paenibacillus oleatilyticus]
MDFQPFISEIVQFVIGLVALVAITLFFRLKKYVITWIETKTTGQQREMLHRVAEEAFAIVETSMSGQKGTEKLNIAIDYVSKHLGEAGIQMAPAAIRAAIEKAVLTHKAQAAAKIGETPDAPVEQSQQAPMPDHLQLLIDAVTAFAMAERKVVALQQTVQSAPVDAPPDPMSPPQTLWP